MASVYETMHSEAAKAKRQGKMAEIKTRRTANSLFYELGLTYHDGLPIGRIDAILTACGFDETAPAIYCGREGRTTEQVGPNSWLSLSWHKMEVTGHYEVVAYLS